MAYVNSTLNKSNSTSNAVGNKPTGLAVGHVMVGLVTFDGNLTITPATGWTSQGGGFTGTPDGQTTQLFSKVADSTDVAGSTFTFPLSGSTSSIIVVGAWSGRNTSSPFSFATVTTNTTSNTSPITLALTSGTALAGDDIAVFVGLDPIGGTDVWGFTPDTGYTERQDDINSNFAAAMLSTKDNVSAGAVGTVAGSVTRTSGSSNAGYKGFVVAIKAAATSGVMRPSGNIGQGGMQVLSGGMRCRSRIFVPNSYRVRALPPRTRPELRA